MTSSDRPSDGSKTSGEIPPEGSKTGAETRSLSGKWGAVAYTADGAFGAAYGIDTREEAERLAIDACRKESTDKNDCSRGVVTRQDSWFHIQFCRRGSEWTTHVTTKPTPAGDQRGGGAVRPDIQVRRRQLPHGAQRAVPLGRTAHQDVGGAVRGGRLMRRGRENRARST